MLCGVLLVSSLCSLCSSATCSAQTCFSLPPLNSLLSERGQRPGTVTYPGGGWRTPHLPPFPERWAVPPHLFILYTPESLILSWITWQCVERAAVSSFQLYFGMLRRINKCSAAGCMESLCMEKKKEKNVGTLLKTAESKAISLQIQWCLCGPEIAFVCVVTFLVVISLNFPLSDKTTWKVILKRGFAIITWFREASPDEVKSQK